MWATSLPSPQSASPMYIDMLPFSSNGVLADWGGLRRTRTRSSRRDRSSGDRDRQSATAFVRLAPHVITRREAEFQFARGTRRSCCAPLRPARMMRLEVPIDARPTVDDFW